MSSDTREETSPPLDIPEKSPWGGVGKQGDFQGQQALCPGKAPVPQVTSQGPLALEDMLPHLCGGLGLGEREAVAAWWMNMVRPHTLTCYSSLYCSWKPTSGWTPLICPGTMFAEV